MLRKTWMGWVIASGVAATMMVGCGGGDDGGGDTNAMTVGMTVNPTGGDDGSGDGSGDTTPADDGMGSSTAPADDGMDTMAPMTDDGAACDPPCAAGEMCIAGSCIGGNDDSTGAAGCPEGETCQMTGGGGMACLGEPTHCVLPCAAGACPDPLACDAGGACSYDTANLPDEPHADWPLPDMMGMCPEGYLAASFAQGFVVCIPECADGCPQGGVCAVNPTSSGMPC